jgi:hypothetical protein
VRLQLLREPIRPANLTFNPEDILLRANTLFSAAQAKDLRDVIADKIGELRHYDVLAIDRVAAILMWGRSGSLLLSSYLDGHEDVLMLPELCGWRLYEFFECYQSLPLRDKLIAYPAFEPNYTRFFDGDFAISPAQYYAAVQAILEAYGNWPSEFLESRRAFFLFVHIAYNLALGRRPATSRPLIVYAQHARDNAVARQLVEDFPRAKFIHTIRDPISSCNGQFNYLLDELAERHLHLPYSVLHFLANQDRPQVGMESRTRAIRFEDLHIDTAETIGDLAHWLGLPYEATLLHSTFNGIPYVVTRDGKTWSGRRLEQSQRQSRYLSLTDRALLFALLYENFVDWQYPCPKVYGHRIGRCLMVVSVLFCPMKMEIIGARAIFKRRILPALRRGKITRVAKSLGAIGLVRLKIMWLLVSVVFRRCAHPPVLVQLHHKQPLDWRDIGQQALQETSELSGS